MCNVELDSTIIFYVQRQIFVIFFLNGIAGSEIKLTVEHLSFLSFSLSDQCFTPICNEQTKNKLESFTSAQDPLKFALFIYLNLDCCVRLYI